MQIMLPLNRQQIDLRQSSNAPADRGCEQQDCDHDRSIIVSNDQGELQCDGIEQ
jgi:hypothetical protein